MTNVLEHFKRIKAFVFDVDGVLATDLLLVLQDGELARQMNSKDGYALQLAVKKGYKVAIISGGTSLAVKERLVRLGVTDVFLSIKNKREVLEEYVKTNNLSYDEIIFMGDDIPDHECMTMVGLPCCPAAAVDEIKTISKYISPIKGGYGCGRDVIEKTLKLNNHWGIDTSVASR